MSNEERILKITGGDCPYRHRKCDGLCNNCGLNVLHEEENNGKIVARKAQDGKNGVSFFFDTETIMNYPI